MEIAVIGGGAAGLATARELLRRGHNIVVFEQGDRIGGTWIYNPHTEEDNELGDRKKIHSSMYKSLRTNLPRESMGFTDYPFVVKPNRDSRRFPSHEEVLAYLEDFANEFGLLQHVRMSTEVMYVGVNNNVKMDWMVRSINSYGMLVEEVFEAVVICNGHFSHPKVAQILGMERWPGRQCHSHNYRTPEPFKDQVVVVIGNAASGDDISYELARVCKQVHWCARSWDDLTEPMKDGKVQPHPMVVRAEEDGTVHFEDGTCALVDVVMHCTGYCYDFPFLDTKNYVTIEDNRVGPLYKHVFPPALAPYLSFVGLPQKIFPFPIFEVQAKWISSVLSGRASLPSKAEMMEEVDSFYQSLDVEGIPKRHTHTLGLRMLEYANWLEKECGCDSDGVDNWNWRIELYKATWKNKKSYPRAYRDVWEDEELHREVVEMQRKQFERLYPK